MKPIFDSPMYVVENQRTTASTSASALSLKSLKMNFRTKPMIKTAFRALAAGNRLPAQQQGLERFP